MTMVSKHCPLSLRDDASTAFDRFRRYGASVMKRFVLPFILPKNYHL